MASAGMAYFSAIILSALAWSQGLSSGSLTLRLWTVCNHLRSACALSNATLATSSVPKRKPEASVWISAGRYSRLGWKGRSYQKVLSGEVIGHQRAGIRCLIRVSLARGVSMRSRAKRALPRT